MDEKQFIYKTIKELRVDNVCLFVFIEDYYTENLQCRLQTKNSGKMQRDDFHCNKEIPIFFLFFVFRNLN